MPKNIKQSRVYKEFREQNIKSVCEICNNSSRQLLIYYLKPVNKYPLLLLDKNNIQTVCRKCYVVLAKTELNKLKKSECELCNSIKRLRVQRLERFKTCKELILDMKNTQTICRKCYNQAKKIKLA